jgi:hypothetical protein
MKRLEQAAEIIQNKGRYVKFNKLGLGWYAKALFYKGGALICIQGTWEGSFFDEEMLEPKDE